MFLYLWFSEPILHGYHSSTVAHFQFSDFYFCAMTFNRKEWWKGHLCPKAFHIPIQSLIVTCNTVNDVSKWVRRKEEWPVVWGALASFLSHLGLSHWENRNSWDIIWSSQISAYGTHERKSTTTTAVLLLLWEVPEILQFTEPQCPFPCALLPVRPVLAVQNLSTGKARDG